MYCSSCGTKNTKNASFCIECGRPLDHGQVVHQPQPAQQTTAPVKKQEDGLIIWGWILTGVGLFVHSAPTWVAISISLVILIIAIALVRSPEKTRKTNGWIILAIWIVINVIAFLAAFSQSAGGGSY